MRRYDREDPEAAGLADQAINHGAGAVEGAAMIEIAPGVCTAPRMTAGVRNAGL